MLKRHINSICIFSGNCSVVVLLQEKCLRRITSEEEFKKTIEKIPDYRIKEEKVRQKINFNNTGTDLLLKKHPCTCIIAKRGRASIGSWKKVGWKDFCEKVVCGGGRAGPTSETRTTWRGTGERGAADDVQPSKVPLLLSFLTNNVASPKTDPIEPWYSLIGRIFVLMDGKRRVLLRWRGPTFCQKGKSSLSYHNRFLLYT